MRVAQVRPEWLAGLLQKDVQSMSLVRVLEAGVRRQPWPRAVTWRVGASGHACAASLAPTVQGLRPPLGWQVTSDAALFALEYGAGEQGPASLW